jgi:gamma-glutamylcyclotransferase (GGCT)/AIG2-like uncharacterized protein YtfP
MRPLFVYGTLKRGFDNQWAHRLWEDGRFLGTAQLPGRLYLVSHYPGLRPPQNENEMVHGEVCLPADAANLYRELDGYEGPGYRRVESRARLDNGEELDVWVYEYAAPVSEERLIPSGRFGS